MSYIQPIVTASGTSWGQFQSGGTTAILENLIAAQPTIINPTVPPSISTNGGGSSGGSLAAGVYYLKETQSGGFGETAPGPEAGPFTISQQAAGTTVATISVGTNSTGALAAGGYRVTYTFVDSTTGGETPASVESAVFTVALGNTPTVTMPATPSFAKWKNLYATAANGSTGSEVLYASGITATTYVMSSALYANGTTAAANAPAEPLTNNTSTNIPQVTFASRVTTGAVASSIYLTQANGNTGTEVRYANGITAATYNLSAAIPNTSYAVPPPSGNETGFTYVDSLGVTHDDLLSMVRAAEKGNLQDVYRKGRQAAMNFTSGYPVNHRGLAQRLKQVAGTFQLLAQAYNESATLVEANSGSLHNNQNGIGNAKVTRQWP